jgi:hypothetical protein
MLNGYDFYVYLHYLETKASVILLGFVVYSARFTIRFTVHEFGSSKVLSKSLL